jgi:hypothetical protein
MTPRRTFTLIERRPGVYVYGELGDALGDAWGEAEPGCPREVWAVAMTGVPRKPDPNEDSAWLIPEPVPPDRLVHLGTPPPGEPLEAAYGRAARRGWPARDELGWPRYDS